MRRKGVKPMMAGLFCIALLATGCSKSDQEGPQEEQIHDYQTLVELVKGRCPESPARQLEFPCFALVAPEDTIRKRTIKLWDWGDKDNVVNDLVLRPIKIKDGLFVRKLNTGDGEFFPVLSVDEAKQLSGNIQPGLISGWNLCLMDSVGSGASATVSLYRADNPYLVLCEREFRLMSELCQKLGAKSVKITDSEKRNEVVGKHGEAGLKINTQQFGGAGNADYEKTSSQTTAFLANTFVEFNGGKGEDKIKRGREDYTPELKARLDKGDPDFCHLERDRKTSHNQTTHWEWKYNYEEKGDKSLMAKLQIGCKILGVDASGVISSSWREKEKWERQKQWYLIATFPKSEIVD